MAEPYRFRNGQWEVLGEDNETWHPADPSEAEVLEGYTSVNDIGQGRLVFYAENGDTMTGEAFDLLVAQVDEAERAANFPWWGPEVVAAFGPYQKGMESKVIAAALNYAQDAQVQDAPGVKAASEISPAYWPEEILGPYPTQEEATAAGVTAGQLAQERVKEYQAVQGLKVQQSGGYASQREANAARSQPGMENLVPRRDPQSGIWYLE